MKHPVYTYACKPTTYIYIYICVCVLIRLCVKTFASSQFKVSTFQTFKKKTMYLPDFLRYIRISLL